MLTKRRLEVLATMIAAEDRRQSGDALFTDDSVEDYGEDYEAAEIVCDGGSCFIGTDHISKRTVDGLLVLCAIRLASEPGSLERYVVTETGRLIAKDPKVADKVMAAIVAGIPCDAGGNPI